MLSNKLTFSLASLMVLLMIGLCVPVSAQQVSQPENVALPAPAAIALGEGATASVIEAHEFIVYGNAATADAAPADTDGLGFASTAGYTAIPPSDPLVDLEEFFRFGGTLELAVNAGRWIRYWRSYET